MNVTKNDGTWSVGSSGSTDTSRVNWNTDGGVRLGKNQTSSDIYITKTFHIPANTTVKVTANGIHNGTEGLFGTAKVTNTVTLTAGSTEVIKHEQKGKAEATFSCSSASASMSSSKNTVKLNSNYNLAGAKVVLKALTIQY